MNNSHTRPRVGSRRIAGFTLIEFMAAMGIFMVVGGAAFLLFRQDVPLFNQQQNLAGLNIAVQNAVTQIQQDVVNAGTGFYTGTSLPSWPVGVTIVNTTSSSGSPCQGSNYTYNATCFDTLAIITTDPNTPAEHLGASGGCVATTATSVVLYTPTLTAGQVTTLATDYKSGDELMLVKSDGSQATTVKLSAAGSVSGGAVKLSINSTNSDGSNSSTNDPLGITTVSAANVSRDDGFSIYGTSFCNSDWILRLQPITYSVDTTNIAGGSTSNPKLIRTQGGTSSVVEEQVIGFRVGACLWNGITTDTTNPKYNYNASTFGASPGSDFTLIRSVRVSLIARTPLGATGLYNYQNGFDGGPYEILGAAIVVNPRNLSMADN
jgi:Tfp pilus assembly protein PilW